MSLILIGYFIKISSQSVIIAVALLSVLEMTAVPNFRVCSAPVDENDRLLYYIYYIISTFV